MSRYESVWEERLCRAVEAWVGWARRGAVWIVLGSLALVAFSAYYTAENLAINANIHEMISPDVPYMQRRLELAEVFPEADQMILVVVDADTPERATDAAETLAARLEQESDVVRGVFIPGAGPFFRRHALLYLDVEELAELADSLVAAQPFLAEISRDPTLRGVFDMLDQTLEGVAAGRTAGLEPAPVLDRVAEALEAAVQGDAADGVPWGELLLGESFTGERRRVVMVDPILDFRELLPAEEVIARIHQVEEATGIEADPRVDARITGDFALSYDEMRVVRNQAAAAGAASFVAVAVLLMLALRSGWLIGASLLTLVAGLAVSLAFASAAVGHLNPISVAFAVLFIGLSVDFAIHLCMRYRELRGAGEGHAAALADTGHSVGSSVVLCTVTTAIGFYAFLPTSFLGVAELGLIAGTGMFISLAFSLTLLPALLSLAPARVQAGWARPAVGSRLRLPAFPVRRPRAVLAGAAVLGAAALVGALPRAHFDPNQLNVRDPRTESVQAFADLLASSETSPWTLSVLAEGRDEAAKIAERVATLPVVDQALTAEDLVPENQAEKMELIRDIGMLLGPPPVPEAEAPDPAPAEQLAALRAFEEEAEAFAGSSAATADPELAASAARLARAAGSVRGRVEAAEDPAAELEDLEQALVHPLVWRVRRLHDAVQAEPFGLDELPEPVRRRAIGPEGQVRVQVFPERDVSDPRALARFVDAVAAVEPAVAGPAMNILGASRAIVDSFQQALATAAVVIVLLLFVLWRRLVDVAIAAAVLGLAALLTVGAAVVVGIPFNYADVIVLPLLLGIGVDSAIHLVHRFRVGAGVDGAESLLGSSTARAVVYSALTTIASFGTLGLAYHRGMATLGQLLTLGVVIMAACNLVVLPALLTRRRERSRTRPG